MWWALAAMVAAIAGAGMQSYATNSANKKAQARMKAAQYELGTAQDKINDQIAQATAQYETGNRQQNQAEEADRIATEIKNDVAESQEIRDEQQTTAGNVSNDYTEARSNAQTKTEQEANAFADLIGQIRSAGNLRMNEGFKLNRYAQNIDQLAKNARGTYAVRQAQAQDDLNSKNALKNWGQAVQLAGTIMSIYGAGAGAAAGAGTNAATTGTNAATAAGSTAASAGSAAAAAGTTAATTGAAAASTAANAATTAGGLSGWWAGLQPLTRAGIVTGANALGSALLSNAWK